MNQDLLILIIVIGFFALPISFYWLVLGLEIFDWLTSRPTIVLWLSNHLLVLDLLLLGLGGPIVWYQFMRGRFYNNSENGD